MSRNKYPQETKSLILDVAEKLFLEKGYDKTTIADIVDDLRGLSKGALYHHFKSKEDILLSIADRIFSENDESERYNAIFTMDMTAEKKLGALIAVILEDKAENRLRRINTDFKKTPQLLVLMLESSMTSDSSKNLKKVFSDGVAKKQIITNFPEELTEIFIIIMNFWINPFVWQTDGEKFKRKLDFTDEILSKFGISPLAKIMPEGKYQNILNLIG